MVSYEDECASCPKELGCLGSVCPNRHVKHLYCDSCYEDVDKLYKYDGEELCEECLIKRFEVVEL